MAKRKKPTPPEPQAFILPVELDDDEEGCGGIPDEDGWIHLQSQPKEEADGKAKGGKSRSGSDKHRRR